MIQHYLDNMYQKQRKRINNLQKLCQFDIFMWTQVDPKDSYESNITVTMVATNNSAPVYPFVTKARTFAIT